MPIRKLILFTLILLTTVSCGLLGGSEPPTLVLTGADGEIDLELGSYCWSNVCADAVYPPLIETFVQLPADGEITLEFKGKTADSGFISLESVATFPEGESAASMRLETVSDPIVWDAGVPAGDYILLVSAKWAGGDASYSTGVTIP